MAIKDIELDVELLKKEVSDITTSQKELTTLMTKQHYEAESEIKRLREDITSKVAVLEKWRYIIIGGSIVIGFILNAYMKHIM